MTEGVKVDIVSPEVLVASTQARSVTVPGAEGYMTVLGDHAPVMTVLKPGFVTVVGLDGATAHFFVAGGFADISAAGLVILAEEALPAAQMSRAEIEARISAAQKALEAAADLDAKAVAQQELDTWKNLLLESASLGATVH